MYILYLRVYTSTGLLLTSAFLQFDHSLQTLLEARGEESIVSITDYTDAFHNFILSQKLTMLLGNFPEVSFIIVDTFMFEASGNNS